MNREPASGAARETSAPKRRSPPWNRWLLAPGFLVALVVGFVILLLVAGSESGDNETTISDDFRTSRPELIAGRRLVASPSNPQGGKEVPTWSTPRGSLVLSGGRAAGDPASSEVTPSMAVVEAPGTPQMVEARFNRVTGDMGVIFRFADPLNYWMLRPAPQYATWNIFSVVQGTSQLMRNTGLSGLGSGTVTVKLSGADIEVELGAHLNTKLSSRVLSGSKGVGLIAFASISFGSQPVPAACTQFAVTLATD